jgi:hypothetical protein
MAKRVIIGTENREDRESCEEVCWKCLHSILTPFLKIRADRTELQAISSTSFAKMSALLRMPTNLVPSTTGNLLTPTIRIIR